MRCSNVSVIDVISGYSIVIIYVICGLEIEGNFLCAN